MAEVSEFIPLLETGRMKANLQRFTSFHTRYYRSSTGAKSSKWLYKQILSIINTASEDVDISVRKVKHSWKQRSIIARFEGSDLDKQNEVVIIGAHQDSVNMWFPPFGRSPGGKNFMSQLPCEVRENEQSRLARYSRIIRCFIIDAL
jgi:bacterial leucyl aminopeptidase